MAQSNGCNGEAGNDDASAGLSQRIRAARRDRGWTQQQVAHKIGITVRSVSGWERGKSIPHLDTLAALARALGQEPERFIVSAQSLAGMRRAARVDQVASRIGDALRQIIPRMRVAR